MKKFLFFAAAAVAMLASCSQNDDISAPVVAENNDATPVQFGTYVSKSATSRTTNGTPGSTTTAAQLGTNKFGVFAYYTQATDYANTVSTGSQTPNFMYNQPVESADGTTWTYSPVKYWPNDNTTADNANATGTTNSKVSFFAYSPFVEYATVATPAADGIIGMTANTSTYDPTITLKLPTLPTASNVVDLLWGTRGQATYEEADGTNNTAAVGTTYNVNLTKQEVNEKVNFLFKHALAKFGGSPSAGSLGGVKIALDLDNVRSTTGNGTNGGSVWDATENTTIVTVKSVTIANGVASGEGALKSQGVFDLATGTWSSLSTDYTFTDTENTSGTGHLNADIFEPAPDPVYNTTEKYWEKVENAGKFTGVTTTLTNLYDTKDALYLIPTGSDMKLNVSITYVVRTYDGRVAGDYTEVEQTISKTITISGGLLSNKQYGLNIYLGLTSVKFTATVAAWGDDDGTTEAEEREVVDLPINVED